MNPIIGRELRSRWRGRRAFGLLLGYSAVLSIAMLWLCYELLGGPAQTAQFASGTDGAGHDVFVGLTWMQTLGWMLVAPALTAPGIASEREQGLLEDLQLAPLSPLQIAWGKLASALLFALVLWLCALPISAICFLLGGVSYGEYLISLLLQIVTAVTGAVIGLYFSAWSRRAGAALRKTFAALIVFNIGSLLCAVLPIGSGLTTRLFYLVGSSNPIVAVLSVVQGDIRSIFVLHGGGFLPSSWWIDALVGLPPWAISLLVQSTVSILLFISMLRALRRPLPEQYWIGLPRAKSRRGTSSTRNASVNAGDTGFGARDAMWWEIPLTRLLHFNNPLLQREIYSKLRMRRVPLAVVLGEALLGLGVLYFYGLAMWWALTDSRSRANIWGVICLTMLIVVMIASPMMGAGAFSREREGGTFESLFLSSLSNRDIILAKILAPLLANCIYGLPMVPLLALCVRTLTYRSDPSLSGSSVTQALATLLILASTAWCYTAWGMLLSWLCRRTPVAVGWTIGTLFLATVFLPILLSLSGPSSVTDSLWIVHPLFALLGTMDPREFSPPHTDPLLPSALATSVLFVVGSVFLMILHHNMKQRARESDRWHNARASNTR
jgi:ABC-type transport system involved in multi-copper enzyme maturation permease subunit